MDVFRAAESCPAHATEAAALPCTPKLFWMQLGIANEEAASTTEEKGIPTVEDACLMVEHSRLFNKKPKH